MNSGHLMASNQHPDWPLVHPPALVRSILVNSLRNSQGHIEAVTIMMTSEYPPTWKQSPTLLIKVARVLPCAPIKWNGKALSWELDSWISPARNVIGS